jgi:hypothetical protein
VKRCALVIGLAAQQNDETLGGSRTSGQGRRWVTLFEFISVMVSIVYALVLGHLLSGVAKLGRERSRLVMSAPLMLWALDIMLSCVLSWWILWAVRGVEWNVARFLATLLLPLLFFFAAALVVPEVDGTDPIDLKKHFLNVRPLMLGALLFAGLVMIADGPAVFRVEPWIAPYRAFQLVGVAILIGGLANRSEKAHVWFAAIHLGGLLFGTGFAWFLPAS